MLDELETRLHEARVTKRKLDLAELEELYTTGCAQVLEMEADSARLTRRLTDLRKELRHVRTAIEWLQEQQPARRPRR